MFKEEYYEEEDYYEEPAEAEQNHREILKKNNLKKHQEDTNTNISFSIKYQFIFSAFRNLKFVISNY